MYDKHGHLGKKRNDIFLLNNVIIVKFVFQIKKVVMAYLYKSLYLKQWILVPFNDEVLKHSLGNDQGGVFFNGNLTALFNDQEEDGESGQISVYKAGKIKSWWITGMTEGETPSVGFTTDLADYYLQEPAKT